MAFAKPVGIKVRKMEKKGVTIYVPKVEKGDSKQLEQKINRNIKKHIERLIDEQYKQQGTNHFTEMIGTFEVKTNQRNILSITFGNYAYAEGFAHGLTLMDSLTMDTETGKTFSLQQLFKSGSNYVKPISQQIKTQIKDRDIPILNSFTAISKNASYYIADKCLVIYFQAYDITPGYVGLPAFPINGFLLEDILLSDGPLDRMLPTV
ncbi:MAG TPA: DUF3298 domain-containing protein [Bacillota bacterium]|nr:DUF3298 domain-containing protein [Bacillota bacterium]